MSKGRIDDIFFVKVEEREQKASAVEDARKRALQKKRDAR